MPACVLAMMYKKATETQTNIEELGIEDLFYACRSCEYVCVAQAEKQRTYIVRLSCIICIGGRLLRHDNSVNLELTMPIFVL